jgi:hypothetical protein
MRASARSSGNASIDRAIEQLELLDSPFSLAHSAGFSVDA